MRLTVQKETTICQTVVLPLSTTRHRLFEALRKFIMADISKLRLRKNAHPHHGDCEEGGVGGGGGACGQGNSMMNTSNHRHPSTDRLDLHLAASSSMSILSPSASAAGGGGSYSDLNSVTSTVTHHTKNSNHDNNLNNRSSHSGMSLPHSSYSAMIKGRRKRRRRREFLKQQCKICLKGLAAATFSITLSLLLLPFSWIQVDYHHQVQHEIQYLVQVIKDTRSNSRTWVRGIHSKTPPRQIVCSDGLTLAIENDNYCDCPDGRDELLTEACSHLLVDQKVFVCQDKSQTKIYTSRVNDGVIDCPDGSDESVSWSSSKSSRSISKALELTSSVDSRTHHVRRPRTN